MVDAAYIRNVFVAKNELAEALGQAIPGTDLIEVYAAAITDGGSLDMTVEEVKELCLTVARQRLKGDD